MVVAVSRRALTARSHGVYERDMCQKGIQLLSPWRMVLVMVLACLAIPTLTFAERQPLTKNVPVWEFQNKGEAEAYDFDAPPRGIFHTIQFAENFEEELGFRRGHLYIPVRPTEQFGADARAVFIVFKLPQHYDPFQVTGLCYPEQVDGLNPKEVVAPPPTMWVAVVTAEAAV